MSKKFADYEKLLGTIPRKGYLEEYAEKHSENSSEMLRRLDDPYYINKLKND